MVRNTQNNGPTKAARLALAIATAGSPVAVAAVNAAPAGAPATAPATGASATGASAMLAAALQGALLPTGSKYTGTVNTAALTQPAVNATVALVAASVVARCSKFANAAATMRVTSLPAYGGAGVHGVIHKAALAYIASATGGLPTLAGFVPYLCAHHAAALCTHNVAASKAGQAYGTAIANVAAGHTGTGLTAPNFVGWLRGYLASAYSVKMANYLN
jgi:hypothetical protein